MKKTIICNWKTTYNVPQILEIANYNVPQNINLVVIPPYPYLIEARSLLPEYIFLGAQDISIYENGPYTGEVTSTILKDCSVNTIIVGHSERRIHFDDSYEKIKKKIEICAKAEFNSVLCVGEMDKDNSDKFSAIEEQMKVLKDFKGSKRINVAYEPVWAVGKKVKLEIHDIQEQISFIRLRLNEYVGEGKIFYGGSVSMNNIEELEKLVDLDGYLIGNASVSEELFQILHYLREDKNL